MYEGRVVQQGMSIFLLVKPIKRPSFCFARSAPTTPGTPTGEDNPNFSDKKSGQIKSRIESWIKDAETDAEKAKEYLGKKRDKLREVEAKRSN